MRIESNLIGIKVRLFWKGLWLDLKEIEKKYDGIKLNCFCWEKKECVPGKNSWPNKCWILWVA